MGSMTNSQLMTLLKLSPTMSQDEMTSKIDTLIDNQSDESVIDFLERAKNQKAEVMTEIISELEKRREQKT